MSRPADAIVTGIAKSLPLAEQSLAPLLKLRQEGTIRSVTGVTWNTPDTNDYAAWVESHTDASLVRVSQPVVSGTGNQRGVAYQIENLRAALDEIRGENDLVLKLRPDFVFDAEFLKRKIEGFDAWSAIPSDVYGVEMPRPAFHAKIWTPWADSNQPFYYEDAAFLGLKRDLRRLVTKLSTQDRDTLGDDTCGSFVHAVRYAKPFLSTYPLFERYLREYRPWVNDLDYRTKLLSFVLNDGFFVIMLIAHAWVLHSHFHVDAGNEGDLRFYSNTANLKADWSKPETLKLANPYDHVKLWRAGTHPDQAMRSVQRPYGRLVDDAWQTELFTKPRPDFPQATLVRILDNVAHCRDGRLSEIEKKFYDGLAAFHRTHWAQKNSISALADAG